MLNDAQQLGISNCARRFCGSGLVGSFRCVCIRVVALSLLMTALGAVSCKDSYAIGDHVLVEWEANDYPAVIIDVEGPARFRVHYDGYDGIWDETVNIARVKSRIDGPVQSPPPPPKVLRRGGAPATSSSAGQVQIPTRYKQGQRIRVVWHGRVYHATVVEAYSEERYRVHYDGFGPEWDETIDVSRIKEQR